VKKGDTLSELAVALKATVEILTARNRLEDPDRIYVGQSLEVPGSGSSAPAAPSEPAAKAKGEGNYVVKPGETLWEIARRHDTSVRALARANGITNPRQLWVGKLITLAASSRRPALPALGNDGTYTVKEGDTLSGIASRHGVSVHKLARTNGITDPDWVVVGRRLSIPGGWQCPVRGDVSFVNDFGIRKPGGRIHEGVDVFARRGAPVVAPVAGDVWQVTGEVGGHQFWLQGDDGHKYLGSHLQRFGASGRVSAGTVVGYVGTSGNAKGTPPHLHFELFPGGSEPSNPYAILKRSC
jgi:LysM repeat protein